MDLIKIDNNVLEQIQSTIDECLPVTAKANQTISDSVVIANGINTLKGFFENKDVKKLVNSMKDIKLGFLTDRPEGGKKEPYNYQQLVNAMVPMMLEGYRFTGNEFNIISGNGMPVKAGKYRKITETCEGFIHSIGTPQKEGGVAKMKCQAKWVIDGNEQTIGHGDDICIIPVAYDQYAGLDKLIGQAESKLYSRVLTRISGKFIAEGEISADSIDITAESTDTGKSESLKDKLNPNNGAKTETREAHETHPAHDPEEERTVKKYRKLLGMMTDDQLSEFNALNAPFIGTLPMEDRISLIADMEKILSGPDQSETNDTSDGPEFGD